MPSKTASRPPRVAFLGPAGTFSYEAVRAHFGADAVGVAAASIPAVFEAVVRGDADCGMVPIENSIEGGVTFTQDALLETTLGVSGEVMVDVEQCLLSDAPELGSVQRVYSHPQALAQCRKWLAAHLPRAAHVPMASTVAAAELVKGDVAAAAVASRLAAGLVGVPVVSTAIQDRKPNITRFVVLGPGGADPEPTGHDKTSLVFSTRDERGALVRALRHFDAADINLCRIESRPRSGETWQYVFFVDFEGHMRDENVRRALEALRAESDMVRLFGSYPRARPR